MLRDLTLLFASSVLLVACGVGSDPAQVDGSAQPAAPVAHEHDTGPQAPSADAIEVREAWTRAVPPNAPVAAGYLTLVNGTAGDDRLVSVSSALAERGEIHEMTHGGDGTMQMRELEDGLPLPGGIAVDLRPGGLHLMFFAPEAGAWQAGAEVPVTLAFEQAGEREVLLRVYAPGEGPTATAPVSGGHEAHHDGHDQDAAGDDLDDAGDHHGH